MPSMRRPVSFKPFLSFFLSSSLFLLFSRLFPLSQAASAAILPSALFSERYAFGARWVFSLQSGNRTIADPHFNTLAGCQKEYSLLLPVAGEAFFLTRRKDALEQRPHQRVYEILDGTINLHGGLCSRGVLSRPSIPSIICSFSSALACRVGLSLESNSGS